MFRCFQSFKTELNLASDVATSNSTDLARTPWGATAWGQQQCKTYGKKLTQDLGSLGGRFKCFFMFTPTWGNDPIWLICFKWVETASSFSNKLPWLASPSSLNTGEYIDEWFSFSLEIAFCSNLEKTGFGQRNFLCFGGLFWTYELSNVKVAPSSRQWSKGWLIQMLWAVFESHFPWSLK